MEIGRTMLTVTREILRICVSISVVYQMDRFMDTKTIFTTYNYNLFENN